MSSLLGIGGGGNVGAAGGGDFYSYSIDQSMRLDGSTAYLSKSDFAASTDTTKRTFSTWVKRGDPLGVGAYNHIISAGSSAIDGFGFANGTAKLQWLQGGLVTKDGVRDLKDTSAWYHIFTTWNATDNEVYIYVNGELDYSSTGSISALSKLGNTGHTTYIGKRSNAGVYIHGYLAETVFLDGYIGDVNDFGELVNGIWVPKDISAASLTYGTNGFYLDYADSSDLGKDVSGQSNHFTSNNLAAEDQVPDSPANNWCILSPLDTSGSSSLFEGNLNWRETNYYKCFSTMVIPEISDTDTYYAEVYLSVEGYGVGIAPLSNSGSANNTSTTGFLAFYSNGNFYNDATTTASGYDPVVGDIISIKAGNGQIEFFLNGTSVGTPYTSLTGSYKFGAWSAGAASTGIYWNFGQDSTFANQKTTGSSNTADQNGFGDFYYAEAANNISLCAANIAEPTIGPNSTTTSDEHFNTVLYTGTHATQSITGVGFQPDWTWAKRRAGIQEGRMTDSVRGVNSQLRPAAVNIETTATDALTSFDADGFTLGADSTNSFNYYTDAHVAWNWKAGGTASTIAVDAYSAGVPSIASSVSVNQDAGFSIVSYTGNLTAGATVGHGLSETPEIIFVKNRDSAQNWNVWNKDLTSEKVLYLNLANGENSSSASFGTHTNQVFGVDNGVESNGSGNDMIAYCFHSVPGYSAVGKYVGNGNADGPFVYTGFRPAWLMVKRKDSTGWWGISDSARSTYNEIANTLAANNAESESSLTSDLNLDFLSNGFKIRDTNGYYNASGITYIYLAFAEAPFKYANAR